VRETALAEHRCAVRKLADCPRQILRVAAHDIVQHVSDDPAVLGVAPCDRPNLLKVSLQRGRPCIKPQNVKGRIDSRTVVPSGEYRL
jgi:hypothetical protein